jgi:hypothetical protein
MSATMFGFRDSEFMLRLDEPGHVLVDYVTVPRELLTDWELASLRTRYLERAFGAATEPKPPMPDLSKDGAFL